MGRWPLALLLTVCLSATATTSARASASPRAANVVRVAAPQLMERALGGSAAFSDPAGDSGSAPDVTTVALSNDDRGLLTFRVAVSNRTSLGADDVIAIPIATDDPSLLGGSRPGDGANFVVGLDSRGPFLAEWNGSQMVDVNPAPASLAASFAGGFANVSVLQEDLAPGFPDTTVPASFSFYVLGLLFNGDTIAAEDDAPNGTAFWSYTFAEQPRLIVTDFDPDKTVKAGKTLTLLMGVARGDTGEAVGSGRATCNARAGSRKLSGKGSFLSIDVISGGRTVKSTVATCDLAVARKLKGKTIRGTMTVNDGTLSVTRPFATRVR